VYTRNGFTTLRDAVRTPGPRVIDRRTGLGKQFAAFKAELVADLGGDPTAAQVTLIDRRMDASLGGRDGEGRRWGMAEKR
jgi:hypothetical protein